MLIIQMLFDLFYLSTNQFSIKNSQLKIEVLNILYKSITPFDF
jgi:hypothetical protein